MVLASRQNSTFVLCSNLQPDCLLKCQTVRSYYSRTLAVPLATAEACAILLASGRSARGGRNGQRVCIVDRTAGGSASCSGRHQSATAGEDAEGWSRHGKD